MAHKSHRQKALQSQLEPQPEISLVNAKSIPASSSMEIDSDDEDEVLISSAAPIASTSTPSSNPVPPVASSSGFAPLTASVQSSVLKNEFRRVPIPPHRMSPLKRDWVNLYTPMVEMLGLQVRMNVKRRCVEMKVGQTGRRDLPATKISYTSGRQC